VTADWGTPAALAVLAWTVAESKSETSPGDVKVNTTSGGLDSTGDAVGAALGAAVMGEIGADPQLVGGCSAATSTAAPPAPHCRAGGFKAT
jgi:hypothetical protein